MYKASDLQEFKRLLIVLRARIRGDVEDLEHAALDQGEGATESKQPTHLAELGTDAYEQEFALRVAATDRNVIEKIDEALARVADGTYGMCPVCQAAGKTEAKSRIPKPRLRAIPFAELCVECERKRENGR
jgi:DnaK suppressor protein